MKILSSDKKISRTALDAALLGLTLILSFVEAVVPITALVPLPGFKLGLSNLGILAAAYLIPSKNQLPSVADAMAVSLGKVITSAVLFGNAASFIFSASGAASVIISIVLLSLLRLTDRFSFAGISVICAVSHNFGQLAAACIVMRSTAVFAYVPLLLAASCIYGTVNGLILNTISTRLKKYTWRI